MENDLEPVVIDALGMERDGPLPIDSSDLRTTDAETSLRRRLFDFLRSLDL